MVFSQSLREVTLVSRTLCTMICHVLVLQHCLKLLKVCMHCNEWQICDVHCNFITDIRNELKGNWDDESFSMN